MKRWYCALMSFLFRCSISSSTTNNQFVSGIIATRSTTTISSSRAAAAALTTQRHITTRATTSAFLSLRPYRASSAETATSFRSVSSSSYNYNSSRARTAAAVVVKTTQHKQQRSISTSLKSVSTPTAASSTTIIASTEGAAITATIKPTTIIMAEPKLLARVWTPKLLKLDNDKKNENNNLDRSDIESAVRHTLSLFLTGEKGGGEEEITVPFVCRYRTDIVYPLTTKQVHSLKSMVNKYNSLKSMRIKLLPHFLSSSTATATTATTTTTTATRNIILTSISKSELDDIYTPFKPVSKGSIIERIQKEYPELIQAIDAVWNNSDNNANANVNINKWFQLGGGTPREVIVQVLGTKIASEPHITWLALEELRKYCRIQTTTVIEKEKKTTAKSKSSSSSATASTKKSISSNNKTSNSNNNASNNKYSETYGDFSGHVSYLKDYQVLAIRRGVKEKALKMTYNIDSDKMEKYLFYCIRKSSSSGSGSDSGSGSSIVPASLLRYDSGGLIKDAIHDAWIRLLKRRTTTRLWNEKCIDAQDRACYVFEQNLKRALLQPPYSYKGIPFQPILALDPGFAAGIKCSLLDSDGNVIKLDTVQFVGNQARKEKGINKNETTHDIGIDTTSSSSSSSLKNDDDDTTIIVALGNGHGSMDCRLLIQEASKQCNIPIDIQLVNEAGASVWSVPPGSLGIGMYQHDLTKKELDEKLDLTCVDAVATVGVDLNTCSLEILKKVPGLSGSNTLVQKIINARPFKRRIDLISSSSKKQKISGLGPKTFENCAGFVRVYGGPEVLDTTNVHPESYELARWLLQQQQFSFWLKVLEQDHRGDINTNNPDTTDMMQQILQNLPPRDEWDVEWKDTITEAAKIYKVSSERILTVLEQLVDSISREDPRLKLLDDSNSNKNSVSESSSSALSSSTGSIESCKPLPPELSNMDQLSNAINKNKEGSNDAPVPIRGIIGTVRNVADFGAFIDIGNENNALLHASKMGALNPSSLLIGQQIGIDILSATSSGNNNRISLGLHGCNYQPSLPRSQVRGSSSSTSSSSGKNKSISNSTKKNTTTSKKRSISTNATTSTERRTKQKRK
ncbi:hypothetical protein FRACYDRAFT_246776 [Fragilariopsis cylindrus CCMP1102]|uniref:S1 motif domain-containing protein n=1 Tax=Fragilariopsis cylindrus CCMP1102 TaxID=635003 RepID=A0A1E7EY62_9STRA|nr:hypothetical protein FRACYDRAFT_246776 [Fragilariopsis cylindrus CCMP1102]|eukprot:OEU10901.1 hypothetical protein FRACYDRAFT_246776 [Fragilariopsis cylindrus CCMP1102]